MKAMEHQALSLKHDAKNPRVLDASDAGTGKTFVCVTAFAKRRRKGGGRLLVLCPRSLMRTAWGNDFSKFAPDMKVSIATAANRREAMAVDADVFVTNHDAVKELIKLPKSYWAKFDELVVDESDAYKHHTSQRSKAAAKLVKYFKRRRLLSATPTGNGVCDIWHQILLLDDGERLGKSFYAFRSTVCEPRQVGSNRNAVQWSDKPGAEEAVFGLINEIVVRHKREDCIDIPETQYNIVDYDLEPKQRKVYDQMQAEQLAFLAKAPISALNAAVVTTKLLQISSGAVYDGSGEYHVVDTGRYELLLDMAAVRRHPLMLFFWRHQKELLAAEAEKRGMTYCIFDGDTNDFERNDQVMRYQRGEYDVVFGHPKTVSYGLTLTNGTSVIWPCPSYNLVWWEQANQRQARIGQTRKTEVVTVRARNTIEEKVYRICTEKGLRMENLLSMFEETTPMPIPTRTARKLAKT